MVGIALLSSGIATINQYMERDLDALMRRTANRPLPSGQTAPMGSAGVWRRPDDALAEIILGRAGESA